MMHSSICPFRRVPPVWIGGWASINALRSIIDLSTPFQAPDQCACSGRMRIRRRLRCVTEVRGGGSAARVRLCLSTASIVRVHASTVRWRFYPRAQVIPPSQLRDPGICPSHERGAHDTHFAQHGGAASHPLLSHIFLGGPPGLPFNRLWRCETGYPRLSIVYQGVFFSISSTRADAKLSALWYSAPALAYLCSTISAGR